MRRNRRAIDGLRPPRGYFTRNLSSPQSRGLVAWWPSIQSRLAIESNMLLDVGEGSIHASGTGGGTNPSWYLDPDMGWVPSFTSEAAFLRMGDPASGKLDPGTANFSLSCWLTAPAMGGGVTSRIFNKWDDTNGYSVYMNVANPQGRIQVGDGTTKTTGSPTGGSDFDDDVWHLMVVTFDRVAGEAKIYRDGALNGTAVDISATSNSLDSANNFDVGQYTPSGGQHFLGKLNDIRFYNGELPEATIWNMYQPQTRWDLYLPVQRVWAVKAPAVAVSGRIMSSLAGAGGLASRGGIAGPGGGLAG